MAALYICSGKKKSPPRFTTPSTSKASAWPATTLKSRAGSKRLNAAAYFVRGSFTRPLSILHFFKFPYNPRQPISPLSGGFIMTRWQCLFLLGGLGFTSPAAVAQDDTKAPLIPRKLLFGNPDKAGAKISPDGKMLSWLA